MRKKISKTALFSGKSLTSIFVFLIYSFPSFSQNPDSIPANDSLKIQELSSENQPSFTRIFPSDSSLVNLQKTQEIDLMKVMEVELNKAYSKNLEKYQSRKNYLTQNLLIADFRNEINTLKRILANHPDFDLISDELLEIQDLLPKILIGINDNFSSIKSERNLAVSSAILREITQKTEARKEEVDSYAKEMRLSHYRIDSISAQPELFKLPLDTLEAVQYSKDVTEISIQTRPVEDSLLSRKKQVDEIQTSLNELIYQLNSLIDGIETSRSDLNSKIFESEVPSDPQDRYYTQSLKESIEASIIKEKYALRYYVNIYQGRVLFTVVIFFIVWLFINRLKNKPSESLSHDPIDENNLILKSPIQSALVITLGIFQFFFINPPFIFYWTVWLISSIALSLIFKGYLKAFWRFFWVCTVIFFLLAGLANMILLPTIQEHYLMYGIASIGVIFLIYMVFNKKSEDLKEKRIMYFIWLLGILEFISMVLNFMGRFNLAKSFMVSGYMGIVLGILLLWTVRLINQGLNIANKVYATPEKDMFFINFDKIGTRAPGIFYFFLILGWALLIGKNFYAFTQISQNINEFLTEERVIGSYAFSINGVFVFLVILFISVLISRLLSLFSADPDSINSEDQRKRISFGSWLLLVQIFVICLGLFLAFAASGIPLDKITIILGALSVGIGLGLQGLVNNLVSGLILAFENTVKVGDLIEIDGKPGTMKSIGFRSSVVNMFEGSMVVIPNGDLISKQLINWTTGKGRKLSLIVGISYESDLQKAVALVKGIVSEDTRIRNFPVPRVVPVEFSDSSIEIEVVFWLNNYFDYPFVKGDLVSKINELFKLNGIKIPFPQRDLHLISPQGNLEIPKKKDQEGS